MYLSLLLWMIGVSSPMTCQTLPFKGEHVIRLSSVLTACMAGTIHQFYQWLRHPCVALYLPHLADRPRKNASREPCPPVGMFLSTLFTSEASGRFTSERGRHPLQAPAHSCTHSLYQSRRWTGHLTNYVRGNRGCRMMHSLTDHSDVGICYLYPSEKGEYVWTI